MEDTPEYKPLIKPYGDKVLASFHSKKDIDTKNNYFTQMDRQEIFVNESIEKAKNHEDKIKKEGMKRQCSTQIADKEIASLSVNNCTFINSLR